jgi:prophage endopeptidase
MNGTELIFATAAILFVAFMAGWFAHWLISRITRVTRSDMDDLDRMAQELHRAEEERDQAVTYMQQREAELSNRMTQTEAELNAAMEGLRNARNEAEDLRGYIERNSQAS